MRTKVPTGLPRSVTLALPAPGSGSDPHAAASAARRTRDDARVERMELLQGRAWQVMACASALAMPRTMSRHIRKCSCPAPIDSIAGAIGWITRPSACCHARCAHRGAFGRRAGAVLTSIRAMDFAERLVERACVVVALAAVGCGAPPASSPTTPAGVGPARRAGPVDDSAPTAFGGGSSDGTTCEEARDAHPDEVGIGTKRGDGPEPPDDQFSGPLSRGTYLDECEVGAQTRVSVCAAI